MTVLGSFGPAIHDPDPTFVDKGVAITGTPVSGPSALALKVTHCSGSKRVTLAAAS